MKKREAASQAFHEFFDSIEATFDVGHAGGIADSHVIVSTEGDARNGGELPNSGDDDCRRADG